MSVYLKIDSFASSNIKEKTYVEVDYTSGTTLTVKNSQGITTNLYALVGSVGQEHSELRRITAISANDLTIASALTGDYSRFTDVTILNADQIKIYRAANVDGTAPADGSFSLIATVDIDTDDVETSYTDTSGDSNYWYKFTYFNSQTSAETEIEDSVAVRGGDVGLYATVDQVRRVSGLKDNQYITDSEISERLSNAIDEVNSALNTAGYTLPLDQPYPPMINNITKILASGYILWDEYGSTTSGTSRDGQAKIDWAKAELDKIRSGSLEVVGADGSAIDSSSGARVGGWPDDTTKDQSAEDSGGDVINRITDVY